ncbi:MAG: glycine cleavage system aminomethyltransferase GcvT [Planctomycetota bacterium]|jgi:aminomethyltransferase
MLKTAFHQYHLDHNAKMVDFAGWEMPLHYGSIIDEHNSVRTRGGLFDVSHMGRVKFTGRHARRFLESMLTRKISDMKPLTCRYSLVCNEHGGVLDDVIVYRFETHWMLVVNASNREKLLAHFEANVGDLSLKIEDETEKTAMIALQGPEVIEKIGQFSREVPTLKRYTFCLKNLMILKLTISRTGYTGEDGVEVILPANMVGMAAKLLLKEDDDPIIPAGLGCRDSLRLEAGMPLYGHELDEETDPISAGLAFAVSLDKDEDDSHGDPTPFIGQAALQKIAAEGPKRKLVGLKIDGKRTPRQGMDVKAGDDVVGRITSGCASPTLGYPIAMAYVDAAQSEVGAALSVDFGKAAAEAEIVPLPFYKRG